ncbi:hypothetical protein SBA3_3330004 [Candidatus Sulfopaludibacter sp. SbA3]|nr:hypothetical protein SBA3_3330004 [Candidatus Sulfopaludibacter sp. SbA3]
MPTHSTTSLKLDNATKERVQRLASARRRSPHWLMREAVEQYVEREEKSEQFRQEALAAWDDYQTTGLHATEGRLPNDRLACHGERSGHMAGEIGSGQAVRHP